MSAIRREIPLAELLALVPSLPEPESPLFRCTNRATGRGRWIKQREGADEFGDVEIEVEGADEFSVVLAHNWPARVGAEEVAELDQELAKGLVEAFSQRLWLSALGCRVHTRQVVHQEATTPKVVRLAAMLAGRDAIAKATWSLGQPKSPEVA